jgi:hypothetical protein
MTTCSTLGFFDSSDVYCFNPVFGQTAMANATVHNSFFPPSGPSPNPETRSGNVEFLWSPAPSLNLPDHHITCDDPNPAPVLGANGSGVAYGQAGSAQMAWKVTLSNLGLSGPIGIVTGRLLALAATDATFDTLCGPVIPPRRPPSPYAMKSQIYVVNTSAQTAAAVTEALLWPAFKRESSERHLRLAFGIGNPTETVRRARIVARAIGRPKNSPAVEFTTPRVHIGVSEVSIQDARKVFTGIVSEPDGDFCSDMVTVSGERNLDLEPNQFRQAMLEIEMSTKRHEACMIDVVLLTERGHKFGGFIVGLQTGSTESVVWYAD